MDCDTLFRVIICYHLLKYWKIISILSISGKKLLGGIGHDGKPSYVESPQLEFSLWRVLSRAQFSRGEISEWLPSGGNFFRGNHPKSLIYVYCFWFLYTEYWRMLSPYAHLQTNDLPDFRKVSSSRYYTWIEVHQ